jgi:hypothetical protein
MREFEEKVKDVVRHAAGENELSDDALKQMAAGVMSDMTARFKKAGYPYAPSIPESPSDAPAAPSSD